MSNPSMYGLMDPAQFTTHSLFFASSELITLNENLDNLVIRYALEELHNRTATEFAVVQEENMDQSQL